MKWFSGRPGPKFRIPSSLSVHAVTASLFIRGSGLCATLLCFASAFPGLCSSYKNVKKTGLFESVSMYFTELLCLHFLVFTCCSHVKSTRLCGKGQGLLQIIIERNKKKKMQRNVRRSWWTCFCGNWKRDQATKLGTRSRFHILQPHP